MAAAILKLLLLLSIIRNVSTVLPDSSRPDKLSVNIPIRFYRPARHPPTVASAKGNLTILISSLLLSLSGDVHFNPGPKRQANIYPCGLCDRPVTWECEGVCCDECSVWHHRSCLELCSKDYDLLHRSNVQWLCCKCDSVNVSSFTFHCYEVDSNYYAPLQDSEISLNSITSHEFSPLVTSSPKHRLPSSSGTSTDAADLGSFSHSQHRSNLRILSLNCRSVGDKKSEFAAALSYLKPDIVCGSESWLKGIAPGKNPSSDAVRSSEVFPSDYVPYRNDRGTLGGGVFILVKKDIISVEQPEFVTDCEICWVKIKLKGNKDMYVGSFYMPHRNLKDLQELEKSLQLINTTKNRNIMLCGDFNCPDIDWPSLSIPTGSPDINIQQELINLSARSNLTQVQETPTREENVLDLVFTTNPSLIKNVATLPGLSDHDMVLVDSITKPNYLPQKQRKRYLYSKGNWDDLRTACRHISRKVCEMYQQGTSTKELWNIFKSSLLSEIDKYIPSRMQRARHSVPWFNRSLKKLIRRKQRLHKKAKKSGDWKNYRFAQKECKRKFRQAEWTYVNNFIEEGLSNNNCKPFWQYVKSKRQDTVGVSPLKKKGVLYSDGKTKAEILLDQFSSVFTRNDDPTLPPVSKHVDQSIENIHISENGILKLLQNLNINKASGPDDLPNKILKECATELAPAVSVIFQSSIDSGQLPDDWTNANIAPVFKKGDRHLPENYRPVSLTSVLSKLLEHVVCRHIMSHLERHRVLTSLNHGFRSGFSCETQLALTIEDFVKNFDNGIQTDIAILDFSKAFDTVPHHKLLHKLNAYGIRGKLHAWIKSFLCNRHMRVVVDGESSRKATVDSGVPQGTVLGPLLFLCHINDLPDCVKSQVRLFADDCLLYRQIHTHDDHIKLQKDLFELEQWASRWGMRFNASKCYILSIKKKSTYFYQLNNTILKEVENNTYLGLIISNDLKWTTHINKICKKAGSTLGFVRRNLQHCPRSTRRTAYISLVRSTLEYGATIWDPYLKSDIDRLERIQRRGARFITRNYKSQDPGCVTQMLKDLDLPTLQERRKELRLLFLCKVVEGLVPAIPPDSILEPIKNKRKITVTQKFKDFETSNIVESHQCNNKNCFKVRSSNTNIYKFSLFTRTVIDWNQLSDDNIAALKAKCAKHRIQD